MRLAIGIYEGGRGGGELFVWSTPISSNDEAPNALICHSYGMHPDRILIVCSDEMGVPYVEDDYNWSED